MKLHVYLSIVFGQERTPVHVLTQELVAMAITHRCCTICDFSHEKKVSFSNEQKVILKMLHYISVQMCSVISNVFNQFNLLILLIGKFFIAVSYTTGV